MNRVRGEGGRFNAGSVRNRSRQVHCFIVIEKCVISIIYFALQKGESNC